MVTGWLLGCEKPLCERLKGILSMDEEGPLLDFYSRSSIVRRNHHHADVRVREGGLATYAHQLSLGSRLTAEAEGLGRQSHWCTTRVEGQKLAKGACFLTMLRLLVGLGLVLKQGSAGLWASWAARHGPKHFMVVVPLWVL